ncbi:DMT family transporter [Demequina sp. TTPB684]|uniref:DMT family transporter n=1 Tax=unclassified Demequina TaxID=2620311 RepID=UPI001CF2A172|nr:MULTISPECIES: DMT family transporter [unclassified Demequina]MCB2412711.1 DMT family transporter [Demequina sp. TTPB684]UPU87834.1 DMT family transporter [Demequina sp. TMPB413]
MLFIAVALAACFVAIRLGLRDAPLLWFAALRAMIAGVVLVMVAGVQRRPMPSGGHAWGLITVLGLVNVTVAFAAMFAGVSELATGTAAVLANAQPLLILLPAWWLYGEAVSLRTAGALLAGFTGLVLVAVPGGGGSGAALSVLSAVAITGGTLLARRLGGLDVIMAIGWHLILGGAALVIFAAVVEGPPVISWTPRFVAVLAFLAVVGTAVTTVLWFIEARRSRLDVLTAWTFLTPVLGIVLAAVAFGEQPTGWTAVGLVTVLVALWVVVRPARERNSKRRVPFRRARE